MSDNRYNGWSNYETWNVNLWIDNDQGSQEYWQERANDLCESNDWDKEAAARELALEIEAQHDEYMEGLDISGCFADILNAAMNSVDYLEIAEHMVADIEQPEEGE